ncbi:hypothetical protein CDFC105_43952 [Clostridioides difficile]|nr:hypothetical protein CDFC105_43952 [Clostridioides difficile]
MYTMGSVSYTHLTLPTTPYVEISVGAVSLKKKKKGTADGRDAREKKNKHDTDEVGAT